MKKISFFSFARQWEKYRSVLEPAINSVTSTQQFIGGTVVEQFEKKFATYIGTKHSISCNSGTDALYLAFQVLNVSFRTIVLTTPFSFIASSSEIVAHGGHPVFIDIDNTYNIDPKKLATWLESQTIRNGAMTIHKETGYHVAGIAVVDLYGQTADYEALQALAKEWNLWIVEDACQAAGAEYNGRKAGTFGDIAAFSFYPTKSLGGFGDGGALTTNSDFFAQKLLQLRNHGRASHYHYKMMGINSRLDGIQAAVLNAKLDFVDELHEKRRILANHYHNELKNVSWLELPTEQPQRKHIYYHYTVQVINGEPYTRRNELQSYLQDQGIETRIVYPQMLYDIDFLRTDARLIPQCPTAQKIMGQVISLPMWPELTSEEVTYVCDAIKNFCPLIREKNTLKSTTL